MRTTARRAHTKSRMVAVAASSALLLAGCFQSDVGIEIRGDGTALMTSDIAVDAEFRGEDPDMPVTGQDLCEQAVDINDPSIEYTAYDNEDSYGCYTEQVEDVERLNDYSDLTITQDGDVYEIVIEGDPSSVEDPALGNLMDYEQMGAVFTVTITFPGEVIEAEGAEIDGNRAVFHGFEWVANGLSATGSAVPGGTGGGTDGNPTSTPAPTDDPEPTSGPTSNGATSEPEPTEDSGSAPSPDQEDALPSDGDDGSGGFPAWAWILIGAGVLGVVGFVIAKKRSDNAATEQATDEPGQPTDP